MHQTSVIVGAICNKQNRYLFWDGIHPACKGYKVITRRASKLFDDQVYWLGRRLTYNPDSNIKGQTGYGTQFVVD